MKLAPRLLLVMLGLTLLPVVLLNRYTFDFFHRFNSARWEKEMIETAELTGDLALAGLDASQRRSLLDAHAIRTNSRIRFLAPDGAVAYDSGGAEDVIVHEDRELRVALVEGRYKARYALNTDKSRMYYFAAVPIRDAGGAILGVAHIIRHTGPVTTALKRMGETQRVGTAWAAALAAALALVFSYLLTRRLRHLRRGAVRYAATGDASGFALTGGDEVADLAREFQDMAAALEQRQAYNRDFVLTTLHELKTPLTAIRGSAEILATRPELAAADRTRFADNVRVQVDRLIRLVGELHALTTLDLNLSGEGMETKPLSGLVRGIADRLGPGLPVTLAMDPEDTPGLVRVQPDRIEQVLVNLLDNAARHAPAASTVRIRVAREGEQLAVSVEDQGPGIAPENLGRVFDRFFTTRPRSEGASGLGLAVAKRIVEHHRGTVFAENLPGGGARVGFRLPIASV